MADALRARSDEDLARLFEARPDLVSPLPVGLAGVAARATTRASLHRALAGLDLPTLQIATVVAVLPPPLSLGAIARAAQASNDRVRPLLTRLIDLGIVFGSTRSVHPVRMLPELLGPYPARLGPPVADLIGRSPARLSVICEVLQLPVDVAELSRALTGVQDLVTQAPEGSRELLTRLDETGPVGSVRNAQRKLDSQDDSPLGWLLARGLVCPVDESHVVLPREVGVGLRGGVLKLTEPPQAPPAGRSGELVERVAPGAAVDIVQRVADLITELDREPAPTLRNGGVASRDVTRLGRTLHTDAAGTALALVLTAGAGLIAVDDDLDPHLRPTETADLWLEVSTGARWVRLVEGWLAAPWAASLVGTRDARGTLCSALSPGSERDAERRLRHQTLQVLVEADQGSGHTPDSVRAVLEYRAPRGPIAAAPGLVETVLHEAQTLGLTAFGVTSSFARPLVDPLAGAETAAAALDSLLPAPAERVLLQADLTAVAPGPLTRATQAFMEAVAEIESRGGATVFRFTPASIERALDGGRD
ncbi:MAG: helicase-associated domain-containing protein, partial [Micrococcus sp.]|nr:helicase-associated domain-containing protein [Micrococcus sp.]